MLTLHNMFMDNPSSIPYLAPRSRILEVGYEAVVAASDVNGDHERIYYDNWLDSLD